MITNNFLNTNPEILLHYKSFLYNIDLLFWYSTSIDLSVKSLKHLHHLGLIDKPEYNAESDVNYLMEQALRQLAFIPFGYIVDKYRWKLFSGEVSICGLTHYKEISLISIQFFGKFL